MAGSPRAYQDPSRGDDGVSRHQLRGETRAEVIKLSISMHPRHFLRSAVWQLASVTEALWVKDPPLFRSAIASESTVTPCLYSSSSMRKLLTEARFRLRGRNNEKFSVACIDHALISDALRTFLL